MTAPTSLIPPLGEPRPQPVPQAEETTLPNGLRLVVVPRPGVPLIELRLRVPFAAADARDAVFHPLAPAVAGIQRRLKQAFDPAGIFNPGRMYAGV